MMVELGENEKFILRQATVKILLVLRYYEGIPMLWISKKSDLTFSTTLRALKKLEEMGIVRFEKLGRTKLTCLTEKGKEVARKVEELLMSIKN